MPDEDVQSIDVSYETEGLTEESKAAYQHIADALYAGRKKAFTPNPPGTGNFNTKRRAARRRRAKMRSK